MNTRRVRPAAVSNPVPPVERVLAAVAVGASALAGCHNPFAGDVPHPTVSMETRTPSFSLAGLFAAETVAAATPHPPLWIVAPPSAETRVASATPTPPPVPTPPVMYAGAIASTSYVRTPRIHHLRRAMR